jgi:phenylpropionate dioxygenase-like ring-hydroxylating dioxygenase large terminal subunit
MNEMLKGKVVPLVELERTRKPIEAARHTPGSIYASEEVFALEKERLFMKDWLCVGREEEVENPGDYFTHTVMGEPMIVARDENRTLHAFYNQCRHRGVEVAEGAGNTERFRCPYHAWTYNLAGQLVAAPFMKEATGFDPATCRLKPLKIGTWAGWIFVSFNPEVGELSEHVAFFEEEFGFLRQQDCRLAHKFVLELNCNWKFVYENLLDSYHIGTVHAKTIGKLQKPERRFVLRPGGRLAVHYRAKTMTPDGVSRIGKMPWMQDHPDDFAMTGFMQPNMNMLVRSDYVRPFLHWPLSVDKTRSVAYFLVPKEKFEQPDFREKLQVYIDYVQKVLDEDRVMVESLQRAMSSRAFEPGPFSTQETSVHHLINAHLERVFPPNG